MRDDYSTYHETLFPTNPPYATPRPNRDSRPPPKGQPASTVWDFNLVFARQPSTPAGASLYLVRDPRVRRLERAPFPVPPHHAAAGGHHQLQPALWHLSPIAIIKAVTAVVSATGYCWVSILQKQQQHSVTSMGKARLSSNHIGVGVRLSSH